jgi:thioredoxin-like negative regulator of GroEL
MALLKRRVFPATLIFLTLAWPVLCAPTPADSVPWYGTLEEATSAAKESGRPILVDFWADWCAACKVMDKNVYSDPAFAEAARGFVTVRINYDQKTAIARKYNVTELPTMVFTDSWGGEIFRHTGYLDGHLLAELLHSLPADISKFNRLDEILARNKNDFHALQEMGTDLRAAGLFLASNEYYERALDTKESKTAPADRATILTGMGANALELKDGKQAADTFERCLKEFPANAQSAAWTLGLGNAYALADKKDKARKILEDLVREHPGSAESEKAKALLASL